MTDYAEEIRAAAQALLEQQAIAAGDPYRLVRDNWGWPLDTVDYPALSVFLPKDAASADGDGVSGVLRFVNSLLLGVVIELGFDKPEPLTAEARNRGDAALEALLTDEGLLDLVEGVARFERSIEYPKEGETFVVSQRILVTYELRTVWEPPDPPPLRRVNITTRPAGESADVPVIKTRIDLPQS